MSGSVETKTVGYILFGSAGGGPAEVKDDGQILFHVDSPTVFESIPDALDAFAQYAHRGGYSSEVRILNFITIRRVVETTITNIVESYEELD